MIGIIREGLNEIGLKQWFEGMEGRLAECKFGVSS